MCLMTYSDPASSTHMELQRKPEESMEGLYMDRIQEVGKQGGYVSPGKTSRFELGL